MRTSSRSRWSKSTASRSFVTAWSRWATARLACVASASKSRRGSDRSCSCRHETTVAREWPGCKVHFDGAIAGHFRRRRPHRPGRAAGARRPRAAAPRGGPGRSPRGRERGCRPRARWPRSSGSGATPSPTRTASSSPRAGSSPATAPARGWRSGSPAEAATADPQDDAHVRFDLRPGVPDLGAFPRAAGWRRRAGRSR